MFQGLERTRSGEIFYSRRLKTDRRVPQGTLLGLSQGYRAKAAVLLSLFKGKKEKGGNLRGRNQESVIDRPSASRGGKQQAREKTGGIYEWEISGRGEGPDDTGGVRRDPEIVGRLEGELAD